MMTDYRTMLSVMAAVQAAAATAAVAVSVRAFELALREAERALFAGWPAAPGAGRGMHEMPMLSPAESYAEWVRGFAALPRVSALMFLGELDRIRGPRAVLPA
jgi:hypothetical protein